MKEILLGIMIGIENIKNGEGGTAGLFQSFIKRRFSFTTFCACANFVNINISANALWQSPLKSYDFK